MASPLSALLLPAAPHILDPGFEMSDPIADAPPIHL
jgi:hypothetical protein